MAKKNKKVIKNESMEFSKLLMMLSFASIVFSAIGYLGYDFWLASTQWLLVAAVMAMFGVYLKLK